MNSTDNSTAVAVPAITRRAALLGALTSSAALAVPASAVAAAQRQFEPLELPADRHEYWGRARAWTPQERVEHHYRELIRAMNALVPEENSRWMVTVFGKNGQPPRLEDVYRFDLVPEPDPRVAGGTVLVERTTRINVAR